ncbi:ABC transporter permease [Olivibacter ginsenosidimutans]|uniref:ABC transporter permease n=1 Tax=Olivibacter ginsenosidimutans TaxID=1176537 RepID=A0ABP9C507_9SPHI
MFTALNIIGLSIGISACFIIYQLVSYEFAYEKAIPQYHHIYSVVSTMHFDGQEGQNVGVPKPLAQAIKEQVTGIKHVVPVVLDYKDQVNVPAAKGDEEGAIFKAPALQVRTQSNYFAMLPYKWLAGSPVRALDAPDKVVLARSRAEQYFPNIPFKDIIGKTLIYNDTITTRVSGIVNDLDFATSFFAKEFFPLESNYSTQTNWGATNSNDKLYVEVAEGTSAAQIQKNISQLSAQNSAELFKAWRFTREHKLINIADMHFDARYSENNVHKANKPVLLGLIGVAIFLLLLAIINFINLSTAQLPQRANEIGVRKTMGSSRRQLILQFLGETFIICSLAAIISIILTYIFTLSFKEILPEELLHYINYYKLGGLLLLFLFSTSLFAGLYPAWLITRVNPIQTLRNRTAVVINSFRLSLRKTLIVFQFTVALLFIIGALIVGQQLHYTLTKDLGFDKDAVLLLNVPWKKVHEESKFALFNELKSLSGVQEIALGDAPLSGNFNSTNYDYRAQNTTLNKELQLNIKNIDTHYLPLYHMDLVAGRNLLPADTVREYLINETAAYALGFKTPQEALGKFISEQDEQGFKQSLPIVGVVKDFHNANFYSSIDPIVLYSKPQNLSTFNIKLNSRQRQQWQATLKDVEGLWRKFYPEEAFEYKFYDQQIESLYQQEHQMAKIINLSTTVAILISCLGLLGLVTLTAFQRTKEIGIRKVLGASVAGIVKLLSKDFIKLVLLAILIASPLAWWAMHKWLDNFAYKIEIQWWVFALAAMLAVGIALLTMSVQAIRAARANPVDSLRNE